jgi:HPt (histidine-containing phosphotransfer) domain-containing protein
MTREMSESVRRALDARWPRVYEASRAHLATIDEFASAGTRGTHGQRVAARSAAHKLSGSLGMYGRKDASAVAASIEDVLTIDAEREGHTDAEPTSEQPAPLADAARSELLALLAKLDGLIGPDPAG